MGISADIVELGEEWIPVLRSYCDAAGCLDWETFSRAALYHPELGYYTRATHRVGKDWKADFYTAYNHSEVFPKLVAAACQSLAKRNGMEIDCFVEIGAEPEQTLWGEICAPYKRLCSFQLGEAVSIPDGSVVFSNEVFDAQPFHRWMAHEGHWHPILLQLEGTRLREILSPSPLPNLKIQGSTLSFPPAPEFPYHIDLSVAASELLRQWVSSNWTGIFVAIDYGKNRRQIVEETPQGSARAYRHHQQVSPLHACPGEQDLTTHVCWDDLEAALSQAGFESIDLVSLSRFLMTHARESIEHMVRESEGLISTAKGQLMELLSPSYFGDRFQVLTAVRRNHKASGSRGG